MATVPTQVRIDENLKKQASELFAQLGIPTYGIRACAKVFF